jgi:cyanoexosortase B
MGLIAPKTSPRSYLSLSMVLVVLMGLLYGPLVAYWVNGWINHSISIQHEYFSHGLLGFPLAAYIGWQKKTAWQLLPPRCHPAGWACITIATGLYLTRLPDWMGLSLPIMLVGLCLCLKSVPGLKVMAMPLMLVTLATPTPWPYLIEAYILPVQRGIATLAGFLLTQFGVSVTVQDIYLSVNGQIVEVAPHCAGLKLLFTSLYVALILLYWTQAWSSKLWTALFLVGTVALSVVSNIIRNALLTYFYGTQDTGLFTWLHEGWGGEAYSALMLVSLVGLLQVIQQRVPKSLILTIKSSSSV